MHTLPHPKTASTHLAICIFFPVINTAEQASIQPCFATNKPHPFQPPSLTPSFLTLLNFQTGCQNFQKLNPANSQQQKEQQGHDKISGQGKWIGQTSFTKTHSLWHDPFNKQPCCFAFDLPVQNTVVSNMTATQQTIDHLS
jgi:hypothetical protein